MKKILLLTITAFSLFFNYSLLAQVGEDPCTAIVLNVNSTCTPTVYNNTANSDSGIPDPGCGSYDSGNTEDMWFKITVPSTGNVTVKSTKITIISSISLAFYDGPCASPTLIRCQDKDNVNPYDEIATISGRTPGETIWVRVWDYAGNDVGTFDICAYTGEYWLNSELNGQIIKNCTGTIFDSGGIGDGTGNGVSDYWGNNENYSVVVTSPISQNINLDIFMDLDDTESSGDDFIYIYNGNSTAPADLLYTFDGTIDPLNTSVSIPNDTITIKFTSDGDRNNGNYTIDWQGDLNVLAYVSQEISCSGSIDGALTAISSGSSPFTYLWDDPLTRTSQTINGLGPNTYNVTVTSEGCIGYDNVTLIAPNAISITDTQTDILCNSDCDGSIEINSDGGTGTHIFDWDIVGLDIATFYNYIGGTILPQQADPPLLSNIVVTGLSNLDGVYYLLDSVCFDIAHTDVDDLDITLISPAPALTEIILSTDNGGNNNDNYTNTCLNMAGINGSITAGSVPFTGTYIPEGDFATYIGENPNGTWQLKIDDDSDGDGGTLNNWRIVFKVGEPATVTGLCQGSYNVTVTDANGCTNDGSYVITEPDPLAVYAGADEDICPGESAFLTADTIATSGGTPNYSFSWSNGAHTQSILVNPAANTNYTVTITDDNACTAEDVVALNVYSLPVVTLNPYVDVCEGSVSFALTGGAPIGGTYSGDGVSGGNFDPAIAGIGTHTITYTYTDPVTTCTNEATETITVNSLPTVVLGTYADICEDHSAITLTGGTPVGVGGVYSGIGVSGGNFDPAVSGDGTFTITYTYTDGNGCSDFTTNTITVNPLPIVTLGAFSDVCLDAAPFVLSGGSPTTGGIGTYSGTGVVAGAFNPAAAGTGNFPITFTFVDGSGCSDNAVQNIVVNSLPTANAGTDAALCPGQTTVAILASGGTNYAWSPATGLSATNINNPDANPAVTTTYTVTVTDGNGCTDTDPVIVTVNSLPNANAGADAALCPGQTTVSLNASGGTSYLWSPATGLSATNINNPIANPASTTTYNVTVTDGNGCTDADDVIVNVNTLPTANAGADDDLCPGQSTVSLNANGGSSYSWSPTTGLSLTNINNPIANPAVTTTYTVTVTDGNGCTDTDDVIVTVNTLPTANAGADASICQGQTTHNINASGGTSYLWAPATGLNFTNINNPVASPNVMTTYVVTVTDANGCTDTDDITITVNSIPIAYAGVNVAICNGSSTTISASGSLGNPVLSYSWDNGLGSNSSYSVTPPTTTTYNVTVTDGNSCTDSDDIVVTVNSLPTASFTMPSNFTVNDPPITLTGTPPGGVFSGPGVMPSNSTFHPGTLTEVGSPYTITYTYTDGNGCVATANQVVNIINSGGSIVVLPADLCSYSSPVTLDAVLTTFIPVGFVPQTGLTIIDDTTAIFDPSFFSDTSITIVYNHTVGQITATTYIHDISGEADFSGLDLTGYCFDEPSANLIGSPPGGAFLINGAPSTNIFNPSSVGVGNAYVEYVISESVCKDTAIQNTTIFALPIVNFTPLNTIYNVAQPVTSLQGIPYPVPVGETGVFSGNIGVSSTGNGSANFNPALAGVGSTNIIYTYTDVNGCLDDLTLPITVNAANATIEGINQFNSNNIYCYDNGPDTLVGVPNPTISYDSDSSYFKLDGVRFASGIDSIGIDSIVIHPEIVGPGTHTLSYYYYDLAGTGGYFWITKSILIDSIGAINILTTDLEFCVSETQSEITGSIPLNCSGVFTYSGAISAGLIPATNTSAWFFPSTATVGNYDIYYQCVNPNTGCKNYDTAQAVVYALPTIIGTTVQSTYNYNVTYPQLIGNPPGGIFSGLGVSNNYFYPTIADTGSHIITYTYTDPVTGCSNAISQQTQVVIAQATIAGLPSNLFYCKEGLNLSDTLVGIPDNMPAYQVGTGYFTINNIVNGPGIEEIGPDSIALYPDSLNAGSYNLSYHYTDTSGTNFNVSYVFNIDSIGFATFIGLFSEFCYDDNPVTLISNVTGLVGTHFFSGNGVYQNGNQFQFDPTIAGASATPHIIDYTFTHTVSGCTSSSSRSTIVNPLPTLEIITDTSICSNEPNITVYGTPAGSTGFLTGPGLISTGDTVDFNPAVVSGLITIYYEYTDQVTGCSNVTDTIIHVKTVPNLNIIDIPASICSNSPIDTIIGTINSSILGVGTFGGTSITDNLDGTALFNPDTTIGYHEVYYTYQDLTTACVDTSFHTILVLDIPTPSINVATNSVCKNDPTINLAGQPISGGIYYIDGANVGQNGNFIPNLFSVGEHYIEYEVTQANGCIASTYDTMYVHQVPYNMYFSPNKGCLNDTITFIGNTWCQDALPEINWSWNMGGLTIVDTSATLNPSVMFTTEGTYDVILEVVSEYGCRAVYDDATFEVFDKPDIDFDWDRECFGDSVLFTNFPIGLFPDPFVTWYFGDGDSLVGNNVSHVYLAPGTYDVTLNIQNTASCTGTKTRSTVIRQKVTSYPYFEDFESTTSSWNFETRDTSSSWNFGTPDSLSAYSGINTWNIKHDTLGYPERSTVVSPCFDITGLIKPMLSMKIWCKVRPDNDGAVLQYSLDYGDWENVGTINSGIHWYDSYSIDGMPGGQTIGWSNDTMTGWVDVRQPLDNLLGLSSCIRFRIAYGSDDGATGNDFAFDDVWIGERLKMVLFEHFTNASSSECAIYDPLIHPEFQSNSNAHDVIDIRYHASYPGTDQMNTDNPADQNARISFYSVPSQLPYSVIDGDQYYGPTKTWLEYFNTLISTRSLEQPKFNIDLTTTKSNSSVSLDASIIALQQITGRNITFNIAIIEKEITSITGANGMTNFVNVVKKLLPDAAGTLYSHDWYNHQSENISLSWTYENVYDPAQIYVVAFLQDEETKEVYQVISDDSSIVATSIDVLALFNTDVDKFILYPNPTVDNVMVLISQPDNIDYLIEVYNNIGELINIIKVPDNKTVMNVDLSSYSEGFYMFKLTANGNEVGTKKLIIAY